LILFRQATSALRLLAGCLLAKLEKLHPEFYPKPAQIIGPDEQGVKKLVPVDSGFVNKDDFVFLYNTCSEVLHEWNPYRREPRVVHFGHPLAEWVARVRRLLDVHWIRLVGTGDVWVVLFNAPNGLVQGWFLKDMPGGLPG
jgi:hypothetical protein